MPEKTRIPARVCWDARPGGAPRRLEPEALPGGESTTDQNLSAGEDEEGAPGLNQSQAALLNI